MTKPRQPAKKTATKSKKAVAETPDVHLGKLLSEILNKLPLGKSLSVLEQIYQVLPVLHIILMLDIKQV